jgi:hypothetical protein
MTALTRRTVLRASATVATVAVAGCGGSGDGGDGGVGGRSGGQESLSWSEAIREVTSKSQMEIVESADLDPVSSRGEARDAFAVVG